MDLKQRRQEAGLTQAELAKQCGCRGQHIASIENGRCDASRTMTAKIERALCGEPAPVERTAEEKELHKMWIAKYGGESRVFDARRI